MINHYSPLAMGKFHHQKTAPPATPWRRLNPLLSTGDKDHPLPCEASIRF